MNTRLSRQTANQQSSLPGDQRRRMAATLVASAVALVAVSAYDPRAFAEDRSGPNLVFILADDLGHGDLGCYGRPDVRTPAIDRLAAEGVRFTNCYANGPECTPTRTAFLTGRYQQRVGGLECAIGTGNVGRYDDAIRLRETDDLGLPVEETCIARMIKEAGYATGIVGKWHLGYSGKFSPNRHGFDYAFYALGGGMDYYHHVETTGDHVLRLNETELRRPGYFTDLVSDEAVAFIDRHAGKPFFLYVPYTAPHSPYQAPDAQPAEPLPESSPLQNQSQGPVEIYRAMIERMDQGVARIMRALERHGLDEKTVVIFTSDNGASKSGSNAPFSGHKGSTLEGGIRVPGIARWPGRLPRGATSDQPMLTMDFSGSLLRLAGAKPLANRGLDGIDILALVQSQSPVQSRPLFWRKRRGDSTWWAVRDGSMKYVRSSNGQKVEESLFDLDRDPAEQNNLLAARPEVVARLKGLLVEWEKQVAPRR